MQRVRWSSDVRAYIALIGKLARIEGWLFTRVTRPFEVANLSAVELPRPSAPGQTNCPAPRAPPLSPLSAPATVLEPRRAALLQVAGGSKELGPGGSDGGATAGARDTSK